MLELWSSENGGLLLFIGQDPKPGSNGAIAYTVAEKRFEALPEWGPDTDDVPPPLNMSAAASIAAVDIATRYKAESCYSL